MEVDLRLIMKQQQNSNICFSLKKYLFSGENVLKQTLDSNRQNNNPKIKTNKQKITDAHIYPQPAPPPHRLVSPSLKMLCSLDKGIWMER